MVDALFNISLLCLLWCPGGFSAFHLGGKATAEVHIEVGIRFGILLNLGSIFGMESRHEGTIGQSLLMDLFFKPGNFLVELSKQASEGYLLNLLFRDF